MECYACDILSELRDVCYITGFNLLGLGPNPGSDLLCRTEGNGDHLTRLLSRPSRSHSNDGRGHNRQNIDQQLTRGAIQ